CLAESSSTCPQRNTLRCSNNFSWINSWTFPFFELIASFIESIKNNQIPRKLRHCFESKAQKREGTPELGKRTTSHGTPGVGREELPSSVSLAAVSVQKKTEAQHQDHPGQKGIKTVYQRGSFGQEPHQDGSHHKSDVTGARNKGHSLGGVHPFKVAPDAEHFRDHHRKAQPVQGKAQKGHMGLARQHQNIARQGDQCCQGHQADGT